MAPKSNVTVSPFPRLLPTLLDPAWVRLDLAAASEAEAVRLTCASLAGHRAVADLARLERDILQRVQLHSLQLAPGITFPHARTTAVRDFVLALSRWRLTGSDPAQQANLLILLGTPSGRVTDHLAVLSSLARAFSQPDLREELLAAATPAAFIDAIKLRL
ncbi:MAG: PTS sugar transporter subunit IIA [Opitutaceae bacterium]|nr:PTS sugar transporter subunit IIA [Opitutaceae bacterium]